MITSHDGSNLPTPQSLLGIWRRFGVNGPVCEIVGLGQPVEAGHRLMRVKVIETGEEIDYRLADIVDDPKER